MEKFSDQQNVNATKFLRDYLSGWVEGDQVRHIRSRFTAEELEGECLQIARSHLSEKKCPGILSYHIACAATSRVVAGSLEGMWAPEEEEKEELTRPGAAQLPKLQFLDAGLVGGALLQAIHQVCSEWAEKLPQLTQVPGEINISFHAIKNTRRKMEDRHALCVDINSLFGLKDCPPQSFYGVFDGHVSVEAAEYTAIHLLPNIVRHPDFLTDPEKALKDAIELTDKRFCQINRRAGCTVVVVLLRDRVMHVAWAGDSQAMLFRKGRGLQLVDPHKPDREDERQRIEGLGGLVIWLGAWRVNGNLSVSRAIGDGADKKFITSQADVRSEELDGTEDYLLVACDGVWDVLNSEEIVEETYQHFSSGGSKQTLAKAVIDAARREGSGDNMTVIVIYFDTFQLVDPKTVAAETRGEEEEGEGEGKGKEEGKEEREGEGKDKAQSRVEAEVPEPQASS